ncbi:MAG TPA: thiamine pyrophosphate-dependent dehydrogenase E1 component subunit alpha [Kineosporiaceae bacterium]|nr:thiamine pyrophosphate-dependent dehydrogenase E1 component subunit alpha [Kineosporiaceae bacterium]
MTADAPPATDRHEGLTAADLDGLPPRHQDPRLYRAMAYVRAFEERVDLLYKQGRVRGPAHLALGHEAIAVGAGSALGPRDQSIGTYRGHAHALVRGADPDAVMLELLGRSGGICAGRGGSMHIASVEHGYLGSHAIIGAHLPIAAGLGWASRILGDSRVTMCFFGDGATNIGAFHEAINLAAVWKLPVVFVCENNGYMEYTPIERVTPVGRPAADRAPAYGMTASTVDGNDVLAVRQVAVHAVAAARRGDGPVLVEARTYRHGGHSVADPAAYRPADEVAAWKARDPLTVHRAAAVARGADPAEIDAVLPAVRQDVAAVARRALAAPPPPVASAWTDMWSDGSSRWRN